MKKQDSAYVIYEIHKCSNATKFKDYPECAPIEEIKKFIEKKFIAFKLINEKIYFNDRDELAVAYSEQFVQSIPMKAGKFSDTGHRFRFNQFFRRDYWYNNQRMTNPFYDYIFYNSDTFDVDENKLEIAEIYFRLNP